ncbi:protein cereblon [Anopheles funestus]|uniref:protein cereblon n=1 Tax=Anopheles funestus TaxID=62324 RepID=UPI0020C6D61C|nr:protein cereblon [Anopheles funestus]XP_049294795.1 protein cereblon [Anopheles funestus]
MDSNSPNPQHSGSGPVPSGSNERDIANRRNRLMRITQRTIDTDDSSRSSSSSSFSDMEDNNNEVDERNEQGDFGANSATSEHGPEGEEMPEDEAARLFEDYIRERESSATEIYNTELPTEHAYLGKMERVEGVDYLEPGKTYRLPIYSHHSIVYPGEIVPLMLNDSNFYSSNDSSDGLKFGLVFQNQYSDSGRVYGVTCQVYERGSEGLSALLKTVAQQRFYIVRHSQERRADVKILPEIVLPDPLISCCSNAMVRYAYSSRKDRLTSFKRLLTQTTVWPQFVYDQYDTKEVMAKVERFLSSLNITSVQTDKVKLSFWLARNIPLTEEYRKMIFCTDSVLRRMLIINKALDHMWYFICKRCESEIANYDDMFAMSKQGVQTSYCNPSGYVHDTLTVHKTKENSTLPVERPSTNFSWFPGYSWQIIVCANCRQHLGWKFVAEKKNVLPKSFYGLSGTNITVKSHGDVKKTEDEFNVTARTPASEEQLDYEELSEFDSSTDEELY